MYGYNKEDSYLENFMKRYVEGKKNLLFLLCSPGFMERIMSHTKNKSLCIMKDIENPVEL